MTDNGQIYCSTLMHYPDSKSTRLLISLEFWSILLILFYFTLSIYLQKRLRSFFSETSKYMYNYLKNIFRDNKLFNFTSFAYHAKKNGNRISFDVIYIIICSQNTNMYCHQIFLSYPAKVTQHLHSPKVSIFTCFTCMLK